MAQIREIKKRMVAVKTIQRITKTMQMIATARFQAAQRRALAAQPYSRKIAEMVGDLASALASNNGEAGGSNAAADAGSSIQHPLLRKPSGNGKQLLLVLTSNRGLCGGYNGAILRGAITFIKQNSNRPLDVQVVGKKGANYLKFAKVPVQEFLAQFSDKIEYPKVEALADKYMDAFSAGEYDAVYVAYMSFVSAARQTPVVQQLLPLQPPKAKEQTHKTQAQYEFSPSPKDLLAEILPVTVKMQLFQAFNDAVVSEHIARMVAMKAATDNAAKMRKSLDAEHSHGGDRGAMSGRRET